MLEWKEADANLRQAVEASPFAFDPELDILLLYKGRKGTSFKFLVEMAFYEEHILNKQVTFKLDSSGYVNIRSDSGLIGLHRAALGLKKGDFKVARHREPGLGGKRDNRGRVLR